MKLKDRLAKVSVRGLESRESFRDEVNASFGDEPQDDDVRASNDTIWARQPLREPYQPKYKCATWQTLSNQTSTDSFYAIEHTYGLDFRQGESCVSQVLNYASENIKELALDPIFQHVDPSRILFLDTETTGLAGGAGTVPFLVGVGFFAEKKFRVEQWILPKLGQEAPILRRLAEIMESFDALASYNGKSFDWPLLRSRFILNRVPLPKILPHLDVLHCARRVLKHRINQQDRQKRMSMRLSDVEKSLLGFTRNGDIPGSLIPARYFAFLRHGQGEVLDAVLEHHRHDIASVVAVLGELLRRIQDVESNTLAEDKLALAQLFIRGKRKNKAWTFVREAMNQKSQTLRFQATILAAKILVEQKNWSMAVACLNTSLQSESEKEPLTEHLQAQIHLTLAKIHEHRLRDYKKALSHAEKSILAEGPQKNIRRTKRIVRKFYQSNRGVLP